MRSSQMAKVEILNLSSPMSQYLSQPWLRYWLSGTGLDTPFYTISNLRHKLFCNATLANVAQDTYPIVGTILTLYYMSKSGRTSRKGNYFI